MPSSKGLLCFLHRCTCLHIVLAFLPTIPCVCVYAAICCALLLDCVYSCAHICTYTVMHICTLLHTHMHARTHARTHTHTHTHTHTCTHARMHTHTHTPGPAPTPTTGKNCFHVYCCETVTKTVTIMYDVFHTYCLVSLKLWIQAFMYFEWKLFIYGVFIVRWYLVMNIVNTH